MRHPGVEEHAPLRNRGVLRHLEGPHGTVLADGGHAPRLEAARAGDDGIDPNRGLGHLDGPLEGPRAPDERVHRIERHLAHTP